jgi:hypothetical protein
MMINGTPQVPLSERSEAFPKGVSIVEGRVNNNVAVFVDVSGLELLSTSPFSDEYGKQCISAGIVQRLARGWGQLAKSGDNTHGELPDSRPGQKVLL